MGLKMTIIMISSVRGNTWNYVASLFVIIVKFVLQHYKDKHRFCWHEIFKKKFSDKYVDWPQFQLAGHNFW